MHFKLLEAPGATQITRSHSNFILTKIKITLFLDGK